MRVGGLAISFDAFLNHKGGYQGMLNPHNVSIADRKKIETVYPFGWVWAADNKDLRDPGNNHDATEPHKAKNLSRFGRVQPKDIERNNNQMYLKNPSISQMSRCSQFLKLEFPGFPFLGWHKQFSNSLTVLEILFFELLRRQVGFQTFSIFRFFAATWGIFLDSQIFALAVCCSPVTYAMRHNAV